MCVAVYEGSLENVSVHVSSVFSALGHSVLEKESGVDGELGAVCVCFHVCAAYGNGVCHYVVCAGADARCAPAADSQDVSAGDFDVGIGVNHVFGFFGDVFCVGTGTDAGAAFHDIFCALCAVCLHVSAGDGDDNFICTCPAADACAALRAACCMNAAAGDCNAGLFYGCLTLAGAAAAGIISIGRAACADAGCRAAALCINGSAVDDDLAVSQISAADAGAAVMVVVTLGVADGGNLAAVDGDDGVGVHSAADAGAVCTAVGCCVYGTAVDGYICEIVSRSLGAARTRLAASKACADTGVSGGTDVAAVDDDFAAVAVVSAADAGAASGALRIDVTAVDGDGSPLVVYEFIRTGAGPVGRIVRASKTCRVIAAVQVIASALDGDVAVHAGVIAGLAAADACRIAAAAGGKASVAGKGQVCHLAAVYISYFQGCIACSAGQSIVAFQNDLRFRGRFHIEGSAGVCGYGDIVQGYFRVVRDDDAVGVGIADGSYGNLAAVYGQDSVFKGIIVCAVGGDGELADFLGLLCRKDFFDDFFRNFGLFHGSDGLFCRAAQEEHGCLLPGSGRLFFSVQVAAAGLTKAAGAGLSQIASGCQVRIAGLSEVTVGRCSCVLFQIGSRSLAGKSLAVIIGGDILEYRLFGALASKQVVEKAGLTLIQINRCKRVKGSRQGHASGQQQGTDSDFSSVLLHICSSICSSMF